VLQLKEKKPDAVIFVSYTSDNHPLHEDDQAARLSSPIVIGDDSGFSDPAFIKNVGTIAQGAVNRSAWGYRQARSVTAKINELFKAKTGYDLDDTSGRNMQAMFVLADAINRAGFGANPTRSRPALKTTDLKPEQLMMGYRGVKFDETGPEHFGCHLPDPAAGRSIRRGLAGEIGGLRSCKSIQGRAVTTAAEWITKAAPGSSLPPCGGGIGRGGGESSARVIQRRSVPGASSLRAGARRWWWKGGSNGRSGCHCRR